MSLEPEITELRSLLEDYSLGLSIENLGLSKYKPPASHDQILIAQNNLIIIGLIKILKKLEVIYLKLIKESNSPHRSTAMIVMKESEKRRGKSRMVINYKRLNDNTIDDAYNLPQKNFLIQFIQKAKIFSKFDLKSGFHQIAMEEESKKWTAFTTTEGHYEWNVMPFGLKNAPSVFQRRMDSIFLPHIATKILEFPSELKTTKEIKSFIGLVNQARDFIPNLGKIIGPLYSKTNPKGEKKFNLQDKILIEKIKNIVTTIPPLRYPYESEYKIIETDGSIEGWGAVLKTRPSEYSHIPSTDVAIVGFLISSKSF